VAVARMPASGPSGACCATIARCAAVSAASIASPRRRSVRESRWAQGALRVLYAVLALLNTVLLLRLPLLSLVLLRSQEK